MLGLEFGQLKSILCLGAHSDDIEIGAGATILKLVRENPQAKVAWVVFAASGARRKEAQTSAERFLEGVEAHKIVLMEFRDGHFPEQWADLKAFAETLKEEEPDLVLTHYSKDLHQDHRIVSEITWNTFRDHNILEYEIPKWDGDLSSPNFYVPATIEEAERKIALLMECFDSQSDKHWFDDLTFRGLMRLRGLECHAPEKLAEAFYARKLRLR